MTRKDFVAIAAILNDAREDAMVLEAIGNGGGAASTLEIATGLANYFETVNPRFDRERFLTACGYPVD